MPTHVDLPHTAARRGTTHRSVLDGDQSRGFGRTRPRLRLVPDLGEYDPAEERIRKQLHAMGVAMGGRS